MCGSTVLLISYQVFLTGGVELWLNELLMVVKETIYDSIENCIADVKTTNFIDEIAQKVCRLEHGFSMQCVIICRLFFLNKERLQECSPKT